MKKFLSITMLFVLTLLAVSFTGCSKTNTPDVWDGSVAEAFAGGDGSEKKPYRIEKASQLAFLAQEVNAGTDYSGKHFVMSRDLDLNDHDWTPIGNGTHSFNGNFDGKNHTISHLKITTGADFTTVNSSGEAKQYTTGLFGSCFDAVIKNIAISKSIVTVQNITDKEIIMGSVLIGTMRTGSKSEISNVDITDASITCIFDLENSFSNLRVGGAVGYLYGNDDSSVVLKNINAETSISIAEGKASYNDIGGIVGTALIQNLGDIHNCASYLSVKIDTENSYSQTNNFGALGLMTIQNNTVSVSNIFSKIITNKIHDISHGYSAYDANVIIGATYHGNQKDGTMLGGYEFKNLFGYIEQVDASTGETVKSMQLYKLPDHAIYTENNCQGCEALPSDHGFDASVWDLTDLSKPKIKTS